MTPEFAGLVNPIFHHVLGLLDRIHHGEQLDLSQVHREICSKLDKASSDASRGVSAIKDFDLAKQALVYWIDEVMTFAHSEWSDHTLEFQYYMSRDRAWKFFFDGEEKARNSSPDIVEVWYLALVLGFKGDITDAFQQHLGRDSLPGNAENEEQARAKWAGQLARQIQETKVGDLVADPLEGDVRPLRGASLLRTALFWTMTLFVVFVVVWFWPVSRQ